MLSVSESTEKPKKEFDSIFPVEELDDEKEVDEFLHIGRASKNFPRGFMRIVTVGVSKRDKLRFDDSSALFAAKIGDQYVLNLLLRKDDEVEDEKKDSDFDFELYKPEIVTRWDPKEYEGYLLLLAKPVDNGFDVHLVSTEFLRAEISAGRLAGSTGEEKSETQIGHEQRRTGIQQKRTH